MKTIIYSLIVTIILGWFTPGFTNRANATNTILLQSTDKHASVAMLDQSAKVIAARLMDFSAEHFDITVVPESKQIKVVLSDAWNLKAAEKLMIQKGSIRFYETYDKEQLTEILKGEHQLYSLLNNQSPNNSSGQVGCLAASETGKVNDYVKTLGLNAPCRFAWNYHADQAEACLYALRLTAVNGALLSGEDIESVKYMQDSASGLNYIGIIFKGPSVAKWADATSRNISKDIAIVLDDLVISAPMVREIITGGNCQITGNFTSDEALMMAALANNGELPVGLEMVK